MAAVQKEKAVMYGKQVTRINVRDFPSCSFSSQEQSVTRGKIAAGCLALEIYKHTHKGEEINRSKEKYPLEGCEFVFMCVCVCMSVSSVQR